MKPAPAALAFAAALAVPFAAAPARAQPLAPMRLELDYDGVLNALHISGELKVLTMHVIERATPSSFDTAAQMKSFGFLRVVIPIDLDTTASGPVEGGLPKPRDFHYDRIEKGKMRHVTLTWTRDAVRVVPAPHALGDPPPTLQQKLDSADPVTLFSRAVYAPNAQSLCARNWRFFDGAELYELRFQPAQAASLTPAERVMGFTEAVRCQVHYAEIAGFRHKHGEAPDEGLRSAISAEFGQLGPTGPWVFLSMKADTFLGYAKVELKGVRVTPA